MPFDRTHSYVVECHKNGTVTALAMRDIGGGCFSGVSIDPRRDLANESDDGRFDVGYPGSGAAQLAVAILADAFEVPLDGETLSPADTARVLAAYHGFSQAVLAKIGGGATGGPFRWEMTRSAIIHLVEKAERRGWLAVAEEYDRNRAYSPRHVGEQAFRRTKK